jgi:hypothetical protein
MAVMRRRMLQIQDFRGIAAKDDPSVCRMTVRRYCGFIKFGEAPLYLKL